jgi:fatty acid desaturase
MIAALAYGGWIALTLGYQAVPWWAMVPLACSAMALYGSLQHETIHGHPTRWRGINEALGWAPLWLWLPYPIYRDEHRQHHDDAILTDPFADPESKYAAPADWPRFGRLRRAALGFNTTLLGRLTIGPALIMADFLRRELRAVTAGEAGRRRVWALHALALAPVLAWLWVCAIPLWAYALLFVYPGLSLTLLRSFAEHRHGRGRTVLLAALPQQQPARPPPRPAGVAVVRAAEPRPPAPSTEAALSRIWRARPAIFAAPHPPAGASAGGIQAPNLTP